MDKTGALAPERPRSPVTTTTSSAAPVTVIRPSHTWSLGLRELWRFRQLVFFLAWRDVKVRYKQTFFGAAWAVFQPVLLMGVFGLFLGRLAGLPSGNLPYAVFVLSGLVVWTFFASAYAGAAQSVVRNANLVSKIYFPRLSIPLATSASFLLDLVFATAVLLVIQSFYGIGPSWRWLALPLMALFALSVALAVGIWLAGLNVRYRDVVYAVPFMTQALLFASPIGYPTGLIPDRYLLLYGLNPIAGLVEGFRWSASGADDFPGGLIAVSLAVTACLLATGLLYFRRTERTFADVI
jgi:lipopolysaccharide transport system permease protein